MILVDSSAWVEFLRATGSQTHVALRRLIEEGAELGTSQVVVMEVVAGARSEAEQERLRALLLTLPLISLRGLADYLDAARLLRRCRSAGETVRSLTDCLIAVPAMRTGASILHNDADFDVIARHSSLRIYPLRS